MNLSTKGRYAVMAMLELAEQASEGAIVPLSSISAQQDLPLTYLEQLFHKLKRHGLIESVRGSSGGYKLTRPANTITIAAVMMAAEESFKTTRCDQASGRGCLSRSSVRCRTHDLWAGLGDVIYTYLNTATLADVLAGTTKSPEKCSKSGQAPL